MKLFQMELISPRIKLRVRELIKSSVCDQRIRPEMLI
tara:strand:+ start:126 stop:236 length:111 start_codon:yes stop_codon:yes gene_type:complete